MKIIFRFILFVQVFFVISNTSIAQWVQSNGISDPVRCFAENDTIIFAGTSHLGVFLSTDNGTSWTAIGLSRLVVSSIAVSDSNLFAGTMEGVFHSTDNGKIWDKVNNGLTSPYIHSLVVSGKNIFAGTDTGVFLSTNNGSSWTAINNGLTGWNVGSLIVSGTKLFVGTTGGVFLSTNNGTSWTAECIGFNDFISCFAISGTNLFAGTSYGVFNLINNGTNWNAVNIGLTDKYVTALAVRDTNLYAGAFFESRGGGIFLSDNNGRRWTEVDTGLASRDVNALIVRGTYLLAGTLSGVWRRPLSEIITGVGKRNELPNSYGLEQNYPNPFNPSTIISYHIPISSHVSLIFYNILGKKVETLINERQGSGRHSVKFDAANLPSGVYFYRIEASSFTETKKMIVLK